MAARPPRKSLIAIGREAEQSYDRVELSLGRAGVRTSPTLQEVDSRIGRSIWRVIADRKGIPADAEYPETTILAAIGHAATLAIDSADRGRMGGSVERIGSKLWDLAKQDDPKPEHAASVGPR
jgi:hypothetical protein